MSRWLAPELADEARRLAAFARRLRGRLTAVEARELVEHARRLAWWAEELDWDPRRYRSAIEAQDLARRRARQIGRLAARRSPRAPWWRRWVVRLLGKTPS